MSKKSNSNQQPQTTADSKKNSEELSEDLDFWNIDTDPNDIQVSPDELVEIEGILAEKKTSQPLKSLSDQEIVMKVPDEQDIINSLDLHGGNQIAEELPDISDKNVDELLANATAEIKAEQEGVELTPEPVKTVAQPKGRKTPVEKIATLACYLAIVGIFTYLIIYASKQHDFDITKGYETNTPVKGDYANIEKIETWWSKPVGNNTRFGVALVPSATIILNPDSKSGVLRSVFYSSEEGLLGKLRAKGDPFTNEFEDGKFRETGTNQITIHGTDGFKELAHYAFYKSQDEKRWTVETKEAPSSQTEINSFKSLANAPIEPTRK
ncbi:MAG: hypothetical protein ACI9E1_001381 [Cryomorphaceae bacterium]|jgi:hypothetical protein